MKLAILTIANLLCLGLIPLAQSQSFGDKDFVVKLVSQLEDQLKNLNLIGKLFETTEENVDSKHGQFNKVTIKDATMTGFEELTLKVVSRQTNSKTGKLEINSELRTGKLQLMGKITFSRNGKEEEKTFVTKIKGSPLGYDVHFTVSPDGKVTPGIIHKIEPAMKAVTFQTDIKKSDGEKISCDTAVNSIVNKHEYHTCLDIDQYISDKLTKGKKFQKTLEHSIKKVLEVAVENDDD